MGVRLACAKLLRVCGNGAGASTHRSLKAPGLLARMMAVSEAAELKKAAAAAARGDSQATLVVDDAVDSEEDQDRKREPTGRKQRNREEQPTRNQNH